MQFARAGLLERLPAYFFQEIDRLKAERMANGVDVIDLGAGDPDLSAPGLGAPGEGYIRLIPTVDQERIAEAVERVTKQAF